MSNQIFPSEIINNSVESNFVKNSKKFNRVYIAILILVLLIITCLPFIYIDITTQSRGIIRSRLESTQIQSASYGLVKYAAIEEGATVGKGDTLLILDTDKINEQIHQTEDQYNSNNIFINDLKHLINGYNNPQSDRYKQELLQYTTQLAEHKLNLLLLKKEYDMSSQLFKEKVTAQMDYLKVKNKYEAAVSQQELFVKTSHNTWQSEISRLELENKTLKSKSLQLEEEKKQYIITSPLTGTLYQTQGIQVGSFITPGQTVAHLSPNDQLIAECYISPADIGYIRYNQDVKFQIDAFNYNQWGLAKGSVMNISEDIVSIDNNPVFKIRCAISNKYLQLKSGHKGYLKKGMTFTGRFYLTNRSLFQLLYDKMDNWLNPKNV